MLKFSLFSADLIMSIKRVVEFTVLKFLFSADLIQSLSTLSLSLSAPPPSPVPTTCKAEKDFINYNYYNLKQHEAENACVESTAKAAN